MNERICGFGFAIYRRWLAEILEAGMIAVNSPASCLSASTLAFGK
jgi:hypothetical protein